MTGEGGLLLPVGADGVAEIGLRPDALRIVPPAEGRIAGTLERVEDLGHEHHAYIRLSEDAIWSMRLPGSPPAEKIDARVGLDFRPRDLLLFGADGRRIAPDGPAFGPT